MGYSIIEARIDDVYCAITERPREFTNFRRPKRGDAMGVTDSGPLEFSMSKTVHGSGIKVADAIMNTMKYLIASEQLKNVLEAHASGPIEFLPFILRNHKGRVTPGSVYVANVLGRIDCGDPKRSEGRVSPFEMDEGAFIECKRLALDERKIPSDAKVFRTTLFPSAIFVRDDVRAAIEAKKMSVRFIAPGEPL